MDIYIYIRILCIYIYIQLPETVNPLHFFQSALDPSRRRFDIMGVDITEADITDDVPSSSRQLSSWLRRTRQNKVRKVRRKGENFAGDVWWIQTTSINLSCLWLKNWIKLHISWELFKLLRFIVCVWYCLRFPCFKVFFSHTIYPQLLDSRCFERCTFEMISRLKLSKALIKSWSWSLEGSERCKNWTVFLPFQSIYIRGQAQQKDVMDGSLGLGLFSPDTTKEKTIVSFPCIFWPGVRNPRIPTLFCIRLTLSRKMSVSCQKWVMGKSASTVGEVAGDDFIFLRMKQMVSACTILLWFALIQQTPQIAWK